MSTDDDTAAAFIPEDASLPELAEAAAACTACDLHRTGTQTVFGDGPADASIVFVGEQPGDIEDQKGRPFVGPAGRELDRALEDVGLGGVAAYRTNVVKHFKWQERRGKRRIHEKPNQIEIRACLPWLHAELVHTRPHVVVPLGATAAKALLGSGLRVTKDRGRPHVGPRGLLTIPTVHPSSVLRARSDEDRRAARSAFGQDLAACATVVRDGVEALLEMSAKPELMDLAGQLDLSGRSEMRKADLISAITERFEEHRSG